MTEPGGTADYARWGHPVSPGRVTGGNGEHAEVVVARAVLQAGEGEARGVGDRRHEHLAAQSLGALDDRDDGVVVDAELLC
ncbi:hypothetical protein [Streptomyces sp. NPDC050704]|uniref:hypothetical protein n=1 Tax=Streptomyces sp. NPDC050704 TaxID=3157219 RepID=UPI0034408AE6